jgi:nuclear transport factor 2 (NTF2) superfamily protein
MNINEIRSYAKKVGENINEKIDGKWQKVKKYDLIKRIQVKEGNTPCFNSIEITNCQEKNCSWYKDCKCK